MLASAARTASGVSSLYNSYDGTLSGCDIVVEVTAVSGTLPTLDIWVQSAHEASPTNYSNIRRIPRINATGKYQTTIAENIQKGLRISYTIGGTTPSFTFSVNLIKHQL